MPLLGWASCYAGCSPGANQIEQHRAATGHAHCGNEPLNDNYHTLCWLHRLDGIVADATALQAYVTSAICLNCHDANRHMDVDSPDPDNANSPGNQLLSVINQMSEGLGSSMRACHQANLSDSMDEYPSTYEASPTRQVDIAHDRGTLSLIIGSSDGLIAMVRIQQHQTSSMMPSCWCTWSTYAPPLPSISASFRAVSRAAAAEPPSNCRLHPHKSIHRIFYHVFHSSFFLFCRPPLWLLMETKDPP